MKQFCKNNHFNCFFVKCFHLKFFITMVVCKNVDICWPGPGFGVFGGGFCLYLFYVWVILIWFDLILGFNLLFVYLLLLFVKLSIVLNLPADPASFAAWPCSQGQSCSLHPYSNHSKTAERKPKRDFNQQLQVHLLSFGLFLF